MNYSLKKYLPIVATLILLFSLSKTFTAEPLSADQAFALSAKTINNNTIKIEWKIAKGFHLYKESMSVSLAEGNSGAEIGEVKFPKGTIYHDEVLGDSEIYEDYVSVYVPVKKWGDSSLIKLLVNYQGCEEKTRCYPPESKVITAAKPLDTTQQKESVLKSPTLSSTQNILMSGNLLQIIFLFFIFGIIISLTPCVLPMVPILAGIIIDQKDIKPYKSFLLSLFYVLGMALTYTTAGIITAMLGSSVQSFLQNFWVVLACSLIFVALALSLFGLYEIQIPNSIANRLNHLSNKTKVGTYVGVFFMGVISSLVISPCVSAPLVGTLVYIASTGNVLLGGTALFSLSMGMGVLLIAAGVTGGKLFLKSGIWMVTVKQILGVVMLAAAIWLMSRVISMYLTNILWSILLIGSGIFFGALEQVQTVNQKLVKILTFLILLTGICIFINTFVTKESGSTKEVLYSQNLTSLPDGKFNLFNTITTEQELNKFIEQGKTEKKLIILDFYADWCMTCKEMEGSTFKDADVIQALKSFVCVKVDLTKTTKETENIKKLYGVFAPPTFIFLDKEGKHIKDADIAGSISAVDLLSKLNTLQIVY